MTTSVPPGRRPATRREWRATLMRTLRLSNGAKLLGRHLDDRMDADGAVRLHRAQDAAALVVAERTVQRRLGELVEGGYLHRVSRGQKGSHSLLKATLPLPGWSAQGDVQGDTTDGSEPRAQGDKSGHVECLPDERAVVALRETPVVPYKKYGERSDRVAVNVRRKRQIEPAADAPDTVNPEPRNEGDESGADNVVLPGADPLVVAPLPLTVKSAGSSSEATETEPERRSSWAVALYDAER